MFDLEREVSAWSASVYAARCERGARAAADELADHLHCEIERFRAEGLGDAEAFAAAVGKLGAAPALAAESARERPWYRRVGASLARAERGVPPGEPRRLLVAHALVWAAVLIAIALVLRDGGSKAATSYTLLFVLLPSWWGSEQILRRALRTRSAPGSRR